MSRSQRAWARGCEFVGAALSGARRLSDGEVVRDHLAAGRLIRTAPSLATPIWVATAVVLMLAFDPAFASGKSINRSGRAPATRAAHDASPIAAALEKHNSEKLLAFGSGYASAHGSGAVRALQRRLAGLGYPPGRIDGRYGPLTEQAVRRFQAAQGLGVDGIDGPLTRAALASAQLALRPGDGYVPGGSGPVRTLQHQLADAGFSPGPIDGRYGPLTEHAVMRFQAARHLQVDGVAGRHTIGRLVRAPRPRIHHRPSRLTGTNRRPAPSRTRPIRTPRVRTVPQTTGPGTKSPGGASLTPWVILLACLMLPALAWGSWHRYRRRERRTRAEPTDDDPAPEPVSEPVSVPATEPALAPPWPDLRDDPNAGAGVFRLAQALVQAGRPAPAVDALRRADRLGHPEAAFELGALLEQQGDRASAEQAYRVGDARGHAGAAFNLGVLLLSAGDVAGAEDAFRRADERGHPGGASNLGVLLEQRGDFAGGRAAYERADERGEAVGAYNLGLLLEQEGDLERASAAFERAVQRGEPAGALRLDQLHVDPKESQR